MQYITLDICDSSPYLHYITRGWARQELNRSKAVGIYEQLAAALSSGAVLPPQSIEERYLGDWMLSNLSSKPAALVRPRSTQDVATTLKICNANGAAIVPQGGRTGLTGGATPHSGCFIISMELMNQIEPVDKPSGTVIVQAGATMESVQRAAEKEDLLFPLDIGSRGSCQIGGNIGTNAGGNRVLRYGMARDLVIGLEAVLADGSIVSSMSPMLKNNTGYDLKQLFVGSEGTLGIVTKAVLRLFPKPNSVQTALCSVPSYDALLELLELARSRLDGSLAAFEVMWPTFYQLGTDGLGVRQPLALGASHYVLVESMGMNEAHDKQCFEEFVYSALEAEFLSDAIIAQSLRESQEIWSIRDSSGEFTKTFWPYVGFDVSLPIDRIQSFVEECESRLRSAWAEVETVWFGHIADSNIHICVRVPDTAEQPQDRIDEIVYNAIGDYGGSVSAEHGIGLLKRDYLDQSRSLQERELMKVLKRALDPKNILNPGKIFVQDQDC